MKKLRNSQMISGSQKATLTMTSEATVSVRPTIWKTRRTGMAMTIAGTIWTRISSARTVPLPVMSYRASAYAGGAARTITKIAVSTATCRLTASEPSQRGSPAIVA